MWKKYLLILISFIGTFSIVFAMNNQINAATNTQTRYPIQWKVIWKDSGSNQAVAMPTNYFYFDRNMPWNSRCYQTGATCNADLWKSYEEGEFAQKTKSVIEEISDSFLHINNAYDVKGTAILDNNKNEYFNYKSMSTLKTSYIYNLPAGGTIDQGTNLTYPSYWTTLSDLTNGFTDFNSSFAGRGILLPSYMSTISTKNGDFTNSTALTFYNSGGIYNNIATSMGGNSYIWPFLAIPKLPATINVGDSFMLGHSTYNVFGTQGFEYSPDLIDYTATPKESSGVKDKYEYSKNVSPETQVGSITYKSSGTAELTLQKSAEADSSHDNDYMNFSITDLDANNITSNKSGTVKLQIAKNAPALENNSLKAKTYVFQIKCKDMVTGEEFIKKVSLIVDKTTATINFKNTTEVDISVGDAVFKDSIETNNTDALATKDVEYTLKDGVLNVLSVTMDADNVLNYDLNVVATYNGSQLPTTYTLSAKIKETTNFKEVETSTKRTINVSKGLSSPLWTPTKDAYSPSDVNNSGIVIGKIKGVDGVGPYTYALVKSDDEKYDPVKGRDNTSFTIDNTVASNEEVEVKTKSALASQTYNMQLKVTDAKGKSIYKETSIVVGTKNQPALNFKDGPDGKVITSTGKKVKFDDKTSSLLAEGGASDNANAIEYDYAPDAMQGGVSPQDYATINKSNGAITPIRTGTIKVQAKRAGDGVYDDIVVYMDLTIDPAEQKVVFNDTNSVINIKEGANKKVDAIGTIKSSGLAGIGSIVYSLDDTTIATVNSNTGDVTGIKAGTVTLTATMNKTGESGYNSNYDTVTATKSIKIYKGMSVTWSAASPKLKANANAIGNKAGTLTVTDNASDPSFAISSNSTVENADASFFKIVDNGATADVQLAKIISASDWESHGGSFKVQVDVTDSNGTQTIDVVITLDEADNDAYFTEGGSKITALTKTYGENSNSFTLTSKTDGTGTTYSVVSDPNGVLTVLGTGAVTINKAGSATVQVLAGAGNGYAQKTVTMVVTIEQGDQSIAFKDTATLNRPFVLNSTFSELAELKETSLDSVSKRNITYTSNDTAVCDIDSITGMVTMKTKGNCDITASNTDANWTGVTTNKVINLYDGMGVSFKQTNGLQAEVANTNAGASAGSLTVNGGIDPKTYAISTATGAKNKDASLFQVNSSGIVSFKKTVTASDLVGKYNTTKKIYELYVQIDTTDSLNTKVTTDAIVEIKGAPLKASFDTEGTGKITEVYGAGKSFTLDLSSNKGGGTPTYQLKNDASMPSDVLQSVDASGLVTILHANDKTFVGNPLKVEAIIPPSNGYEGETIETEVEITQATQPDFAFVTPNIKLGHGASITPTFTGQLASGMISMTSGNNALATINGNDIKAKTTDGTVTITAIESGDRDYKRTTTTATVTISSAPAYDLVLNVPSATYGDTGLTATVILNDATGGNQTQTWSSSDPSIAEIAQGTKLDESGVITIHKAGTVTISCTQTSTGEPSVTATAILVIDPKPISVTIDNASKYVGEAVPNFHATIPTSDLVGRDTIGQPVFSCKDGSVLVNANTKAGKYDINATYPTGSNPNYAITITKGELTINQDTSQADWYHLEGATSNTTLNPNDWHKEDVQVVLDSATESAGTYDEISLDNTLWDTTILVNTEGNLNKDIAFRIKDTNVISTLQSTTIKIDKTKPVIKSITGTQTKIDDISKFLNNITFGIFFKPGTEISIQGEDVLPNPTTITSGIKEITYNIYEIDRTTGVMNPIAVKNGTLIPDASGKVDVTLNDVGLYRVCALSKDNAGNTSLDNCSDVNIKKIDVDIDNDGEMEFQDPDQDGCPDINIALKDNEGKTYKINVDRNKDDIPDLNIDSDGDGNADINIDTDNDKKPDINIVNLTTWTPTFCVVDKIDSEGQSVEYCTMKDIEPIINIRMNKNKIADINIDTDGDLVADINIDQNKNKRLDVNDYNITTKLDVWTPNKDFNIDEFIYDTQTNLKAYVNQVVKGTQYPSLNIDSDGDGLPDLNIDIDLDGLPDVEVDGDGDGIVDFNLDPDGTGTPQSNIRKITSWSPSLSFVINNNTYLTMSLKGSNELEDNGVIIDKPSGETFLPNFAFKTEDVTTLISENDKEKINAVLDEGVEIKQVFSVSLLKDNTAIQPDGIIRVRIPILKGIKNPKLVIAQKDGTQKVIDAVEVDGYYVYETDYLSMVSVVGDKEIIEPPIEDKPDVTLPNGKPGGSGGSTPDASVKGDYSGNIGGAGTGDTTNVYVYTFIMWCMIACIYYIYHREVKKK